MSADKVILIIGGGIAGLAAAQLLNWKFPARSIIVVEQAEHLGGLLGRFDYGRHGIFDRGMHWYTEVQVPAIDELFLDLLPFEQWNVLERDKRDLSGLYYRGRLQTNSQYPDLRHLDRQQYRACLADFFANLQVPLEVSPSKSLFDFSREQFGTLINETVISPIAARIHGAPANQLDELARCLPLLDRVVLFDEKPFLDLMNSETLRARIAFPDQRRLPLNFSSGRRSYYPKIYGIHRIVDALADRLRAAGVELLTNAKVTSLKRDARTLTTALIECNNVTRDVALEHVIWAGNPYALAVLLNRRLENALPQARRTVIVSALLKSRPRSEDLYCFFCADAPHSTYRVTNFVAFCPNAVRPDGFPISIELLVDPPPRNEPAPDYAAQAVGEIGTFGIIDNSEDVKFAKAELLPGGFPGATRQNIVAMDQLRAALDAEQLVNLVRIGILAEPQLFFQHDILSDVSRKIDAL